MRRRLLQAWIDAHIGWHQGRAERAEATARRNRQEEARWRDQYERRWPNPYRKYRATAGTTRAVGGPVPPGGDLPIISRCIYEDQGVATVVRRPSASPE